MLYRSTTIRHPSGVSLKTPLLVPSFSSRGFRFDKKDRSEIRDVFINTAEILTESMLVSAYDIAHGHLPRPERFPCTPSLIIVDSGGYETGADHDYSSIYRHVHNSKAWSLKQFQDVLDVWPSRIPAIFVNYDKNSVGQTLDKQLTGATKLFSRYPNQMHTFLLKPTGRCKGLLRNTVKLLEPVVKDLGGFSIIGITEKELGHTMLDRMETVAVLRGILDKAGVKSPIQVFGALDPLSSCLYFLAGAEVFDGLTWLRFAYVGGQCVYPHNYGVLSAGVDGHDDFIQSKMFSDNYSELRKLQLAMRDFASTNSFAKLKPHDEFFQSAYDSLVGRIGGGV